MRAARRPIRAERKQGGTRRAVTLLELLAVITIMLMITAAAIPMVLPAMQGRQIREEARQVSAFLAGARARAIENGRPVGVLVQRFGSPPQPFSMNLSYTEVPPPYAGSTQNSRAMVSGNQITWLGPGDVDWQGLLRWGDTIKFNYQGRTYRLWKDLATAGQVIQDQPPWSLVMADGSTTYIAPQMPPNGSGAAFQIFRQPVKLAAAPLQVPEGRSSTWAGRARRRSIHSVLIQ